MPRYPGALVRHLHDHLGLVTDRQLRQLDVTVDQRRRLVTDQVLERVVGDVYRSLGIPRSLRQTALAATLADDRAVVTGRAAGKLWGVRDMGPVQVVDVHLPHGANALTGAGIRVRRCPPLPGSDVSALEDGIRIVSPPRLAFDLAAHVSDETLESVIEQVLDRRWCTVPTLIDVGRRLFAVGRPGAKRFARVIESRPGWLRPVDSRHELVLANALQRAGVPTLVRQVAVPVPAGWTAHPDLALPEIQWAIEIDHVDWHGGRVSAQRDKQRDRELHAIGWQIDRVADHEVDHHLRATVRGLVAVYRRRLADFSRVAA